MTLPFRWDILLFQVYRIVIRERNQPAGQCRWLHLSEKNETFLWDTALVLDFFCNGSAIRGE